MKKDKVQIYIAQGVDFDGLIEKVVKLRESEGKVYKPFGAADYTVSEVIIDALAELAKEYDERMKVVKK